MGLFDRILVCPKCRDGVIPANNCCPTCGTAVVKFTEGTAGTGMFNPSDWKKKSFPEQKALIREALAGFELEKFVTTSFSFENYEIEEYFGPVTGTDIYLIGGVMGGGLASQEKLFDAAFSTAKSNMVKKAQALGANAVIGMQVNLSAPGTLNNMIVAVVGTAVKIKEK